MTPDKSMRLGFVLTATDQMSKILENIGSKTLNKFQQDVADVGKNAMLIGGQMEAAGERIFGFVLNTVKAASNYGDAAYKTAQKVGMGVEEWQKLAYAAEFAGVANEQLATGIGKFDKVLVEASKGTGTATKAFKDLGIETKDAAGKMRAPQNILADVANIFSSVADGAEKSALAQELFGKAGKELIPLLNSGAGGLAKMYKEAEQMGLVLSKEASQSCEQFNDNLKRVDKATLGLKIQIGNALMPTLEAMANWITRVTGKISNWIGRHKTLAKIIGVGITVIGGLLIGLGSILIAIGACSYMLIRVIKLWNGVFNVLIAVKNSHVALVAWQKISTGAMWVWSGAVRAANVLMNANSRSMLLMKVYYTAYSAWSKIAAVAQWIFNASIYGCPVVWIIAAIIAVIAAVVLLVKHWDKVAAFFKEIWAKIKKSFLFVYNLQSLIEKQSTPYLKAVNKRRKHAYKINKNVSWASLKDKITDIFLTHRSGDVLLELQALFEQHLEPVRSDRSFPRQKKSIHANGKFKTVTNYKRCI
jgi:hypothetical protein